MKKLISIFAAKKVTVETEKPQIRLRSSIVPEGHGTMSQFNEAWQSIAAESMKVYEKNRQN
jgi:hypothetical protein